MLHPLTLLMLYSVVMADKPAPAQEKLRLHLITYNVAGGPPVDGVESMLEIEHGPDLVSLG